jgi:hypothetical protein
MSCRVSLFAILSALLLAWAARADDRYDKQDYQRYRKAMDKIIWGDERPGFTPGPDVGRYAAIAYSPSTGKHTHATGLTSLDNVKRLALARCGARDARVIVWVKSGCCALAVGRGGVYAGRGPSPLEARMMALRACRSHGSAGSVVLCVSSGGGPGMLRPGASDGRRPVRR